MHSTQTNPLLDYCLEMHMCYSYKPVLILSMLGNDGRITIQEAASFFISFYKSRLAHGLLAEKSNSIYCNLNCSLAEIRQNIINNPLKALINSSPLFKYDSVKSILEIDRSVWYSLTADDLNNIYEACHKRLDLYYDKLTNHAPCKFQNPDGINGYLSNDYPCQFVASGNTFISMTQYMAYRKAQMLGLRKRSRQLLETKNPGNISDINSELSMQQCSFWEGQQQIMAYQGLMSKFTQNSGIAIELLNTGSSLIAACLPDDPVWGIGLDIHNAGVSNVENWQGKNLLGFSLMQVRNMVFGMRSL